MNTFWKGSKQKVSTTCQLDTQKSTLKKHPEARQPKNEVKRMAHS